jgi:hypothetical protein
MSVLVRLLLGIVPLLLTVLFAWLVIENYLNFGAGEKDIFVALPLLIWSLVYLISYLVLWPRGSAIGRSVAISSAIATGFVVIAWIGLFGASGFMFR